MLLLALSCILMGLWMSWLLDFIPSVSEKQNILKDLDEECLPTVIKGPFAGLFLSFHNDFCDLVLLVLS